MKDSRHGGIYAKLLYPQYTCTRTHTHIHKQILKHSCSPRCICNKSKMATSFLLIQLRVMSQYIFLYSGLAFVTYNAAKTMSWLLRPGQKRPCSLCLHFLEFSLCTISKPQCTDDTILAAIRLPWKWTQMMSKDQLPTTLYPHCIFINKISDDCYSKPLSRVINYAAIYN